MEIKQVSDNCFAVLNEKNRVCDRITAYLKSRGALERPHP